MDSLTYSYYYYSITGTKKEYDPSTVPADSGILTNKLAHIDDKVSSTAFANTDIDDQDIENYQYDETGNLIKDTREGISNITWTVYGKINTITKTGGSISYTYDASGNRISKTNADGTGTWYVRDATGNVMAVYTCQPQGGSYDITMGEAHLYGSSRLGIYKPNLRVNGSLAGHMAGEQYIDTFVRGKKFFELSNHLGNVLVTISDKKIGLSSNGTTAAYYKPEIVSASDYAPFGMQLTGRNYSSAAYRYGFNGKEKDPETYGEGNVYDYGMRIYNPRLGRFLSVDPLTNKYPELTPYQFASNMPIIAVDLDGEEAKIVTIYHSGTDGKEFYRTVKEVPTLNTALGIVQTEVITVHKYPVRGTDNKVNWVTVTGVLPPDKPVSFQTGRIDLTNNTPKDPGKKYNASEFSVSENGVKFLASHEGVKLDPYNDSKNFATVGIGHLIAERKVNEQDKKDWAWLNTKEEAYDLLNKDLTEKYVPAVRALVKVPVTQEQFDAIVSFTYNVGIGSTDPNKKPGLAGSFFLKSLNEGNYNGDLMLNYKKPPEIVGRRKDEVQLFNTGTYENNGTPIQ